MLFRFTLAVGRVHLAVVPLLPSAQSLWEDFVAVPCPLLLRFSGHVTPAGTQLGLKVCGLDGAEGVRAGCGPSPAATFAGGLTQSPPQAPAAQALCLKCPGGLGNILADPSHPNPSTSQPSPHGTSSRLVGRASDASVAVWVPP